MELCPVLLVPFQLQEYDDIKTNAQFGDLPPQYLEID